MTFSSSHVSFSAFFKIGVHIKMEFRSFKDSENAYIYTLFFLYLYSRHKRSIVKGLKNTKIRYKAYKVRKKKIYIYIVTRLHFI